MSSMRFNGIRAGLALLSAVCTLAITLSGCGVGGIIVIAAAAAGGGGGGSSKPGTTSTTPGSPTLLFSDGFEGALSDWTPCGSSSPSIAIGAGTPGNALTMGGGAASSGEAVTLRVFGMGTGLTIAGDLRVGTLGATNCQVWMGLRESAACDGLQRLDAGIVLDSATGQRRYILNGTQSFSDSIPDTQYHRYLINIRADCRVEFYADGVLVHVTPAMMQGNGLWRPVSLGGRDLGGSAEADNISVTGRPPVGMTQYQSGFAFASLSPAFASGSGGGASVPSIDPSGDGQPAPSFNPGGGATGSGEVLSAATYDATKPLELRASLRVPVTSTADAMVWFGLEGGIASSGTPNGLTDLCAGVIVDASIGAGQVQYVAYSGGGQTIVATRAHDTNWHAYRVVVRPDFHVEFYRDGLLEFVTPNPIPNNLGTIPLSLGGRSTGGNARADSLSVITPPLGESLAMNQLTPTGTPPSARYWHGAIFDERSNSMIMIGGFDNTNTLADVWRLDFRSSAQNGQWAQLTPTGTGPTGVDGHVMAYDSIRHRILVFGGFDGSNVNASLWELDLSTPNGTWSQLTPSGISPTGVWGATGVFDTANDRLVVFGGEDNASTLTSQIFSVQFGPGNPAGAWTVLTPSGTGPTARNFCPGVYDPASSTMIIGPGDDQTASMPSGGEIWLLTLSPAGSEAWQQASPSSPPMPPAPLTGPGLRRMAGMALWPGERRVFMFGGEDPNASQFYPPAGAPNEIWALNLSCLTASPDAWFAGGPSTSTPVARRAHSMVWDPVGRRAIVFGGEDAVPNQLNDVWEFVLP